MLNGHVQFAASSPLRLYGPGDIPGLNGPPNVLGTTAPLAHAALGVKFPGARLWQRARVGVLPRQRPPRSRHVGARGVPRRGRWWGRMQPAQPSSWLWISTGEWAATEVRISATNAPGKGQGIMVLLEGIFADTG
jgi:hypothetical protein